VFVGLGTVAGVLFLAAFHLDYTIEVRRSILEETDGPMLIHGLQGQIRQ
jgi:hypothetical protein